MAVTRIVILSGGSEIISTALVESFAAAHIPMAIISLVSDSLVRDVVPDTPFAVLSWPPDDPKLAAEQIVRIMKSWGAAPGKRWPIFPTEDGGLRLLLEQKTSIEPVGCFGHAHALQLGGLDKAELFDWLDQCNLTSLTAPTRIITSPDQLVSAVQDLGGDCVIKPSLKPLSMQLTGMPAKAFMTKDYTSLENLTESLHAAWSLSSRWVVQQRLKPSSVGEALYWGVRDSDGNVAGMTAVERIKQPRYGGTGCWVQTDTSLQETLHPLACKILNAIDFKGICELPFLLDTMGNFRLLELNPRPWLQVGLTQTAGTNLITMAARILQGEKAWDVSPANKVSWVNAERLFLSALSGEYGSRLSSCSMFLSALREAASIAIYSSSLPKIKRRWIINITQKLIKKVRL